MLVAQAAPSRDNHSNMVPRPTCILPTATVMVVTVTATTTSGRPLTADEEAKVKEGCAMMLALDADKAKVKPRRAGAAMQCALMQRSAA